jgi:cytochrome c-type biogenesis protein
LAELGAGEEHRQAARYAALVVVVVVALLALVGYAGYVVYPRFDLPSVEGAALLPLAAAAGVASFFSPCSLPLLVGLLGRQAAVEGRGPAAAGAALAEGAALFMLLAGAVIAVFGEALFAGVTFTSTAGIAIRATVGTLLVLLGLIQLDIVRVSFRAVGRAAVPLLRSQARLRRERPVAAFAVLGFGYVLAGFG